MPFLKGRTKTGGRQKGVTNKRTQQFRAAVADSGLTPLEYMLAVLRDEKAGPDRRDRMAVAAAPYIHPRLANVDMKATVKQDVRELSHEELMEIAAGASQAELPLAPDERH